MKISQQEFFNGLSFEECEIEYITGKEKCYKGKDDCFYRIDHFGNSYVIEFAEDEKAAKLNQFEDGDLFDDSLPKDDLIKAIQDELKKYVAY